MMLPAMIKIPLLHYRGGGYWTLPPMLGGHRKTMRKIDYCGKPWVAGKAIEDYFLFSIPHCSTTYRYCNEKSVVNISNLS